MSNAWRWSRVAFCNFVFVFLLASRPLPIFAADKVDEIHKRGTLLWGGDAEGGAPYSFPNPQKPEEIIGFECDLADALAAKLGVKAKMVQNQWDQLIPALERGNFDILLNGLELTADNQQHIAMTQPYFVYAQQIVTRKETDGLNKLEDLRGKEVGVLSSSVAERLLESPGGQEKVKVYPGNVESFRDLKAKRVEAVLLDLPIALFYAKSDPDLKFAGAPFAQGYYGIGVRKEDLTLLAALNQAIKDLANDHTLERIYSKYGLWDDRQLALKDYRPEVVEQRKAISTLREWPRYLPLL